MDGSWEMQLHHPRPRFRTEGDHQVTIQPDGAFITITLSEDGGTFLYIREEDVDRLARACATAKAMFQALRDTSEGRVKTREDTTK